MEHLPSTGKALGLIPSTGGKKHKQNKAEKLNADSFRLFQNHLCSLPQRYHRCQEQVSLNE